MEQNNGGPAFPIIGDPDLLGTEGMSLRDYFAAKAMQGFVASNYWAAHTDAKCAEYAYALADTMLAARNGG